MKIQKLKSEIEKLTFIELTDIYSFVVDVYTEEIKKHERKLHEKLRKLI